MSVTLRNRFALAALLGTAVFFGPDIETARTQEASENRTKLNTSIPVSASNRTKLQLSVYPGNLAMIAEQRTADIPEGQSILQIDGLAPTVMDDSFLIGTPNNSDLVWTSLRNSMNGTDAITALLRNQIGKEVIIRRDDDLIEGKLLSLSGMALVQTDAGIEQVPIHQIIISKLPDGFSPDPSIEAEIATTSALDHLSMAYLLGGIGWNTSYVGHYDSEANNLTLSAIARVTNQSGAAFDDAQLRLVAGDPNRVSQAPMPVAKAARNEMMMSAMADSSGAAPDRESFENLHVYGPFDGLSMQDGDTVILPLIDKQSLPVTRRAIFNGSSNAYNMGQNGEPDFVRPDLEIKITNKGGADNQSPWPDGVVRIFANSTSGDTRFVGEDNLSLTPVEREATLRLGKASDVSGTRHVTSFTRKARPNMPDAVTADLEWKISNTSSRAETITIYENMPSDWVVNAENHKHVLVQPGLIRWDIDVPANQEVTVSWSVSSIN